MLFRYWVKIGHFIKENINVTKCSITVLELKFCSSMIQIVVNKWLPSGASNVACTLWSLNHQCREWRMLCSNRLLWEISYNVSFSLYEFLFYILMKFWQNYRIIDPIGIQQHQHTSTTVIEKTWRFVYLPGKVIKKLLIALNRFWFIGGIVGSEASARITITIIVLYIKLDVKLDAVLMKPHVTLVRREMFKDNGCIYSMGLSIEAS